MLIDDPKDPIEETETVDPDLEEEQEDEPSPDEPDPADPEEDEDPETPDDETEQPDDEAEDDLPTDPKALRQLVRQQQKLIATRSPESRPEATDDEAPDPFLAEVQAVIKDKRMPLSLRRVVYGLTQKLAEADNVARTAQREAARVGTEAGALKIPEAHRKGSLEIAKTYGIPLAVAHQLYKGQLYDQATTRRDARKRGEERPERPAPAESTRRTGAAQHTATRPVRSAPEGSVVGGTVKISGISVPLKFKSSADYATFMDKLPSDRHRAIVLKARRDGRAARLPT